MDSTPIKFRLNKWGKKIAAVAFIILILIGNVWLIFRFTGDLFPQWSLILFAGAVIFAFGGGLLMIPELIWPTEMSEESDESSENDKAEG